MYNHKVLLSLGAIATLYASSSAYALHGVEVANHQDSRASITHVAADTLEDGALKFVSSLTQKGIGVIENNGLSEEKRKAEFRKLLNKNFDMKTIGRFALGRYWKTSSKQEQKEYLKLFENMIVEVYSKRFNDYNGQKIEVTSARPNGKSDALVSSSIVPDSGPNIDVDWRVRKKKNGQYKVIDIMVEGVSMSLTQRSDFASVIQRGGGKVEVLLAHLRPKE